MSAANFWLAALNSILSEKQVAFSASLADG